MNVKNSYRNLSPANFEVEVKKNVFIPMPDGVHLAADLGNLRDAHWIIVCFFL